ncbi:MAG: hypothetical protein HFG09_04645 [Oscillibacter sp.]|nr:hypothetical protein [Oscillibacter sp.]
MSKKRKSETLPRLERKWGRIVLGLMGLTFVCALLPVAMYYGLKAKSAVWLLVGAAGAILCMALGVMLRIQHLRCPSCKRGLAVPQWKPGRRYLCPVCRKPFLYDDEP